MKTIQKPLVVRSGLISRNAGFTFKLLKIEARKWFFRFPLKMPKLPQNHPILDLFEYENVIDEIEDEIQYIII